MSLDAYRSILTQHGAVTISAEPEQPSGVRIVFSGFDGVNCSCRDVAVLAGMWAIGELQRETMRSIEQAGAGATAID